jgi:hypothetical protein
MTKLTSLEVASLHFPLEQLKPVSSRRASETLTSILNQLTGLSELTVGNSPYLDAAGLATIARLPLLQRIGLRHGSCQVSTLAALPSHITSLRLGPPGATDSSPSTSTSSSDSESCETSSTFWSEVRSALTRLRGLQELQLTGFKTVPSNVITARPVLPRLGLHDVCAQGAGNLAQSDGTATVAQLTALQQLRVSDRLSHMRGAFDVLDHLTALHISGSSGDFAVRWLPASALDHRDAAGTSTWPSLDAQCLPR